MYTNQSHNSVSGDIVAGNKTENVFNVVNAATVNELAVLYSRLKHDGIGASSGGTFCEQLEHYLAAKTEGDVRGLEAKLMESGRTDQLDLALRLKERAAKAVMRHQSSKTAQRVYTILLDELHTGFSLMVTPAIQSDEGRREVDKCINDILQSTSSLLGENILEITVKDLLGLLYFLGGNCHIRWDKC